MFAIPHNGEIVMYVISDDTVTFTRKGKPFTTPRTDELVEALRTQDFSFIDEVLNAEEKLAAAVSKIGKVEVFHGHVTLDGKQVHGYLVNKILDTANRGLPIDPLAAFLERVDENPSLRVREDLFSWVEASQLPILPDGRIVAYRLITSDYKDIYTKTIDNSVGRTVTMERRNVDDRAENTCSYGLHFCNAKYLPHYGPHDSRVVIVAIDPADVVAFPKDYGLSKGRCQYEVLEEVPKEQAAQFFADSPFIYNREDFERDEHPAPYLSVAEQAFVDNFDAGAFGTPRSV